MLQCQLQTRTKPLPKSVRPIMHRKFVEVGLCGLQDMQADRQTHRVTHRYRHAYHNTLQLLWWSNLTMQSNTIKITEKFRHFRNLVEKSKFLEN